MQLSYKNILEDSNIEKIICSNPTEWNWLLRRQSNGILYIRKFLTKEDIGLCVLSDDGRVNSCLDENIIIDILKKQFGGRIIVPKIRM